MFQQKIFTPSYIVFGLICIALSVAIVFAVQDSLKTPAERLTQGVQALESGQYRQAERHLLMVQHSDDKEASIKAAAYLGQLYLRGGEGFSPNGHKAEIFLEQAANAGVVESQYQLALMYDTGDKIPENREKAKMLMNQAAKQGYPDALYALGVWIERGYFGEPAQMDKVLALYEAAAVQGQRNAMASLVNIYSDENVTFEHAKEKATYWTGQLKNNK